MSPRLNDYAIVADEDRHVLTLHEATCPAARAAADAGMPVITMFGCAVEPNGAMVDAPLLRHEKCLP